MIDCAYPNDSDVVNGQIATNNAISITKSFSAYKKSAKWRFFFKKVA